MELVEGMVLITFDTLSLNIHQFLFHMLWPFIKFFSMQ